MEVRVSQVPGEDRSEEGSRHTIRQEESISENHRPMERQAEEKLQIHLSIAEETGC